MKKILSVIIALFCSIAAGAFFPLTKNWSSKEYEAANQNWTVGQDSKGIIYAGNHYGLLEFDGFTWILHKVGDRSVPVRSIYIDGEDRIYVGTYYDIGYFERNRYGGLEYHSLLAGSGCESGYEIWSIAAMGDSVCFQTFSGYYLYRPSGRHIEFIKTDFQLRKLENAGGEIISPSRGRLMKFDGKKFRLWKQGARFPESVSFKAVCALRDSSMIVATEDNRMFLFNGHEFIPWKTEIDGEMNKAVINSLLMCNDTTLLVGTITGGVYAFGMDGGLLWHLDTGNGLNNNTVLDMHADREGNVWVALDYGLTMIYNASVSVARPDRNIGSVFDVLYDDGKFYIATNQGLFIMKGSGNSIHGRQTVTLIKGTEGFVMDLYRASDGTVFLGHNKRTIALLGNGEIRTLSDKGGAMCFKTIVKEGKEYVVGSCYTGFEVYGKGAGGFWKHIKSVKGFKGSVQYFEEDSYGRIWAGDSKSGLYRLTPDRTFSEFADAGVRPSPGTGSQEKTGVFKIKDNIVFTDGSKCWSLNHITDRIEEYGTLNEAIGVYASADRITRIDRDNYWFITKEGAAVVNFSETTPRIVKRLSYRKLGFSPLDNYENIVPYSADRSILCTHDALADISHRATGGHDFEAPRISGITSETNSNINRSRQADITQKGTITLNHLYNSLRIKVSYPVFKSQSDLYYRLSDRHEWEKVTDGMILLNNLPTGRYYIEVKAGTGAASPDNTASVSLRIRPPFYFSAWAILVYFLTAYICIRLFYHYSKKKSIAAARQIRQKQQQEILRLQNEKLQSEITFKSKELANSSMNMLRRTEMLQTLKDELIKQKHQLGTQYPNKYYNRMMSMIEENMASEQEWEIFKSNFDLIHRNFFNILIERYPDLSPNDLKLCALLHLNLDTKEIAQMTNVTVRGVETRRYRLRKKLNLGPDDNLNKFLESLK